MKTTRGLMPLATTQFLSARYQNAEPDPACSSGATGTPDSCAEDALVDPRAGHRIADDHRAGIHLPQLGDPLGVKRAGTMAGEDRQIRQARRGVGGSAVDQPDARAAPPASSR